MEIRVLYLTLELDMGRLWWRAGSGHSRGVSAEKPIGSCSLNRMNPPRLDLSNNTIRSAH